MNKKELMARAILLSKESVECGGGPFGAVIARNGEIVAEASNRVTIDCDPTAHAEVSAIRKASKVLGTFNLSGCKDAANIGFDDDFIYKEIALTPEERQKPSEILMREEALKAFEMWREKGDKTEY